MPRRSSRSRNRRARPIYPSPRPPSPRWVKLATKPPGKPSPPLRQDADPALQPASTEASLRCAEGLAASGDRKTAVAAYEELLAPSQPVYVRRAALDALIRLDKDQGEQRILEVLRGSDSALKPVAIANVRALRSNNASRDIRR